MCAYLAVRGRPRPPYLRFRLPGGGRAAAGCLVHAGRGGPGGAARRLVAGPADRADGLTPRRERPGPDGQRRYLERVLAEPWWRERLDEVRVLATRIPAEWGAQYHLYRDSMNPVMTAALHAAGRLAHRSPPVRGLYLAGSCHPSGAVGQLLRDLGHAGRRPAACEDLPLMLATTLETSAERPAPARGPAGQRPAAGPAARLSRQPANLVRAGPAPGGRASR